MKSRLFMGDFHYQNKNQLARDIEAFKIKVGSLEMEGGKNTRERNSFHIIGP